MHEDSAKEITSVREIWKSGVNYHKFLAKFHFPFKLYKKEENGVLHPISKHLKIG